MRHNNIEHLFLSDADHTARPIRMFDAQRFQKWCEGGGQHTAWAKNNQFTAAYGQVLTLPDASGGIESVLVGLGAGDNAQKNAFALSALPPLLSEQNYRLAEDTPDAIAAHAALAWGLGAYHFDTYKSKPKQKTQPLLVLPEAHIKKALPLLYGIYRARDLINTPACDMLPSDMQAAMARLAKAYGATLSTKIGDELLTAKLNMIHAVGRAAKDAPRMLDMQWVSSADSSAPLITLVGKGVCFDSGGLNLKPGNSMALMKKDMGGAAIALGLAEAIMAADLPVRLRVLIGAVENAIGADAFRPGDVLHSHKGLRVEIGNTDAEGRLVLADLLSFAQSETQDDMPDIIFDFATLTGAARVALGPELVPFYTHNDEVASALAQAAEAVYDPLWRMPLWDNYNIWLKSSIADVNHISSSMGGSMAGSITAALFLARFVAPTQNWVHFDAYGWQNYATNGHPIGGAAQSLQAVFHYIEQYYKV